MSEPEDTAKLEMISALRTSLAREANMPARIERIKARLAKLGHKLTSGERRRLAAAMGESA